MKTRIIKTGVYTDENIFCLTPDTRFICIYLYTNSHIDLIDVYKLPLQVISLETGYDMSIIKIAMDQLQERGIIKHYNYLWLKLLREDFASLMYSGEKNEKAIEKYISTIPNEIKDYLEIDSSIDTSMHTSDKSEIINQELEIINKEQETRNKKLEEIIKEFESINPACKDFYGNKTQRKACNNLIDTYGFEKVISAIKMLEVINPNPKNFYKATTPKQLWDNWVNIKNQLQATYKNIPSRV